MRIIIVFIVLIFNNLNCYCQNNENREREANETMNWINSKLLEYRYQENDLEQLFILKDIIKQDEEFVLMGIQEQKTSKPWGFKKRFMIPILKINNISFIEKKNNYWIEIKIKNDEKAIYKLEVSGAKEYSSDINILLSKTLDQENLRPRLKKAFYYLLKLYGYEKTEKF